jgi:hypothetical protein
VTVVLCCASPATRRARSDPLGWASSGTAPYDGCVTFTLS